MRTQCVPDSFLLFWEGPGYEKYFLCTMTVVWLQHNIPGHSSDATKLLKVILDVPHLT